MGTDMSTFTSLDARASSSVSPAPVPRRRRRPAFIRHIGLTVFALFVLYPLIWLVISSFKPAHLILSDTSIIPDRMTVENYRSGWTALNRPFWVFFANSLIVALGAIVGNIFSCSLTSYALARLHFRMRNIYFGIVLVSVMLPMHVMIIPQYIVFSKLGLVNTFVPLVLPKFLATDAFFIFLMVQFIRGIPRELDQAAMLDGAGPFKTFFYIILPLMTPALVTTTIFTFIWTWNDFFTPLIYLTKVQIMTVPIALRTMVDAESTLGIGELLAMSVLSLVPIMLFFAFAQKYLVRGIATTGLK